jgi:pilus assembly protein Flp/PilA
MNKLMSFLKDEDGQGMIEYAIIIGAIAIAAILILIAMKGKITKAFNKVNNDLDALGTE